MKDWDDTFLRLAEFWAGESKDPSTKVGACVVRPDNTVAAEGYNGFPRFIKDDSELLENREEKLKRTIHAEMNALLIAREQLKGYTLYTYPLPPCHVCINHIIQKGIIRVVSRLAMPMGKYLSRWSESCELAKKLAEEAGIDVEVRF